MAYTVAQNTTFLTAASVLQKVISFFYFTILARSIGVENTGQYFFALTFTTIFSVIADFGLGNTLTREAAKFPDESKRFVATAFWSKVLFGFLAYGLVLVALKILRYPASLQVLICLSGITMLFDNLQTVFYSFLRARKNLFYEAIGMVFSQFLTLIIGGLALFNHWPLYSLIIAYTIPSLGNLLYAYSIARRVGDIRIWNCFSGAIFKNFLVLAWPIALAGVIGRLYAYSDSLLMSKMVSTTELGWWSVPYKMTFAFQFIPIALAASLYPVISAAYVTEPAKVGELVSKAYRYLFTIIFPLALGLGLLARPVITAFYGSTYLPAVPVLQILLASLVFTFLILINGAVLNAVGKQKIQTTLQQGIIQRPSTS
jgi:O-antigen/teichoic acid export membrane protein